MSIFSGKKRNFSPSFERNCEPICGVLVSILTGSGEVLEIGSGTGQHVAQFGQVFPSYHWQATDLQPNLESIDAWILAANLDNLRPAIELDLVSQTWPVNRVDAIVCINTIHIVAWPLVENLFAGVGRHLKPGGVLYIYGPFEYSDRPLEPSNADFNAWLKNRDPESGIRKFSEVNQLAVEAGLVLEGDVAMPANNRSIWWRKR